MTDYITERELNLALDPLKADIWEMKADVKTLVLAAAVQKGAADAKSAAGSRRSKVSDRKLAYAAIVAGLIAPIGWLNIPNPFH